jgi:hypothetical protein
MLGVGLQPGPQFGAEGRLLRSVGELHDSVC